MKEELLRCLQEGDFKSILQHSATHKRILSQLTALTYHPEALLAWRAVHAIGLSAGRISEFDPEYVRNHLRRLFWLLSDESGGIGWRAPEAIGEILACCPGKFDEFISPLFHLLDMEAEAPPRFRAGVLWAIGRVSPAKPEAVQPVQHLIIDCLGDANSQIRGLALWCLSQIKVPVSALEIARLKSDRSQISLFLDGQLVDLTVGEITSRYYTE